MAQTKHMLPIADMGNYQAVLSQQQTLRDVYDESHGPKEVTFQNPYKFDSRRKGKDMSGFVLGAEEFDLDSPKAENEPSDDLDRDVESPASLSVKPESLYSSSHTVQDEPVAALKRKSEEPLDESRDMKRARAERSVEEEPEIMTEQQRPKDLENVASVKSEAEAAPLASGDRKSVV